LTPSRKWLEYLAPRIPRRLRLVDFHPAHAALISERSDHGIQDGLSPRQRLFLYGFQAAGGPALSVCTDDALTACFGVFPVEPGIGEFWTVSTTASRKRFPKLTLQLGQVVLYSAYQYLLLTKLQIRVQRTNEVARRYAERLGFHMEPFDNADEEFVTMEAIR
jgi:hypothetical protein